MFEVLIVEDDPMVAMINKQYVSQNPHFHVADICKDGLSALEYLKTHLIHLVILDVYMPRSNGLTLLQEMRAENIDVSVIMVTAANDTATVEQALKLGIVDYLVKPFMSDRFQQALEKYLFIQQSIQRVTTFSQEHIDTLVGSTGEKVLEQLPKGIQTQTLDVVVDYLKTHKNQEHTAEEIADQIGLSRVTIRRYMNYLLETGKITGQMNYETGGRPCMVYRLG
ncbi:MAG: response regulator [Lachnospira sp.]|nr:response regulator [Lachnospira sp.]